MNAGSLETDDNQVLRDIAIAHVHNLDESARLFALANLAMADAIITAWTQSSTMSAGGRSPPFKRPTMTAIRKRSATRTGNR